MKIIKRVMIYCLGMLFLAFGVSFSVKSQLGVSPVNSIPYMISHITGIDQGLITTCVFSFYVVIQIIILRKDYKLINLFQIVFTSVFGLFITFSNHIVFFNPPDNYFARLILLFISIVVIAIGLMFYLTAEIMPMPAEGIMLAISSKTDKEFSKIKVIFDCTVVGISILLSLVFLNEVTGIREGTIIAAILIGKVLQVISKRFKPKIVDFIES